MIAPAAGWTPVLLEEGVIPMEPEQLAPGGVLHGKVNVPVNVLLLRGHDRTVLVDTGSGILESWWPGGKRADLEAALAGAGCRREDVGLVVLTHLDFDHVGGVLEGTWPDDLRPAFPQAPVVLLDEAAAAARAGDADAKGNAATRCVAVLESHGLLQEVTDGAEFASGLRLRAAPGHRAGHACLELCDSENPFIHLADIVHHPLHAEHPEWDQSFDTDPELALETRRRRLAEAADRHARVVASHVRSPNAARIERVRDAFVWSSR